MAYQIKVTLKSLYNVDHFQHLKKELELLCVNYVSLCVNYVWKSEISSTSEIQSTSYDEISSTKMQDIGSTEISSTS